MSTIKKFRLCKFNFFQFSFQLIAFASAAGGLRTCDGALFASLEKYATHFSNSAFGVTEPNNAPYTGTGNRGAINRKFLLIANTRSANRFIDPHSYQYLQKRLIRFGTAAGGMGLMAKPYQTQKANAAALELSVIIDLKEDSYSEFKYYNMVENNKAAAIATALLKKV